MLEETCLCEKRKVKSGVVESIPGFWIKVQRISVLTVFLSWILHNLSVGGFMEYVGSRSSGSGKKDQDVF